ncbi:MAG: hypothetical protein NTV93_12805 [Verrucomicrobia bacterium]|nr:hypothetical protein [Verrucomicrobiota bacterium]
MAISSVEKNRLVALGDQKVPFEAVFRYGKIGKEFFENHMNSANKAACGPAPHNSRSR